MRQSCFLIRGLVSVGFLLSSAWLAGAAPTLTGEQIIKETIARARSAERVQDYHQYAYSRQAITEELDAKGSVKTRKEKTLEFQGGVGAVTEMKVNGRPVPAAQVREQESKISTERRELTQTKSAGRDDRWETLLTPELLEKYTFTLVGQENLNGRSVHVLSFKPARADLPIRQMLDRVMNNMTGKLWIDTAEYEVARAQLRLLSEVDLWGGVLASLKKFEFAVERMRLPDGTWFNQQSRGEFAGRKLFGNFRVRTRTESGNFRKLINSTQVSALGR